MRTYFVSVTNSAFYGTRPAAMPLLGSFQMEQLGEQIRFVDADGSIYDGALSAATNAPKNIVASRAFRFADSSQRGAVQQGIGGGAQAQVQFTNWNFQATGVSRTLGSRVV